MQKVAHLSADLCRNLIFLQKGAHFLQIYAEIYRNLGFLHKSAEMCAPLCRNCISAERGTLSVDFCRNLRFLQFLQKCVHLSADLISAER
jgi:hypothetical protein